MSRWAYLFEHPGADPDRDRMVLDGGGVRAVIVAVPSAAAAVGVAVSLATEEGAALIELCGGFTRADAAAIGEAVGERIAVGHVSFAVESLAAGAAYAASAVAAPGRA